MGSRPPPGTMRIADAPASGRLIHPGMSNKERVEAARAIAARLARIQPTVYPGPPSPGTIGPGITTPAPSPAPAPTITQPGPAVAYPTPAGPTVGVPKMGTFPPISTGGVKLGALGPHGGVYRYVEALESIVEVKTQPYYHLQTMTAATAYNNLTFFNLARGPNRRTTNLPQARQIPGANAYRVRAFGFRTETTASLANTQAVQENGVFQFMVNDKEQFLCPTIFLPAGGNITGISMSDAAAAATLRESYGNGIASHGALARLMVPIIIKGGQQFEGILYFGAAVTPAATDIDVEVIMWGEELIPI